MRLFAKPKTQDAWLFMRSGTKYRPGERYQEPYNEDCFTWEPEHYSFPNVEDAVLYALGPIVAKVRVWNPTQRQNNRICGDSWTVLWMTDASRRLREFAVWAAKTASESMGEVSLKSIEVAERFCRGEASAEELKEAYHQAMTQTYNGSGDEWLAAWCCSEQAHDAAWRVMMSGATDWPTFEMRRDVLRQAIEALTPPPQEPSPGWLERIWKR